MLSQKEALNVITSNIPKWMDGNKRTEKSVSGKFFSAVASEQEELEKKLEEVKDSFFLVKYLGKENKTLCQVYIAPVGNIDNTAVLQNIEAEVTDDPRVFMEEPTKYVLLQNGYFFISPEIMPEAGSITYVFEKESFRTEAKKRELWNIFDEFAAFSSLKRYENETNAELMQRCLNSFRYPTNSTEEGLKNAIVNAIANYATISKDNICIEVPNAENIYLKDADGEIVYNKLSKENMDTMITKIWDHARWDNAFAGIDFIDGKWDKKLEYYQDGTGQGKDLKAILEFDNNSEGTTDVYATGYKTSQLLISNYIRRQGIHSDIPISMKKYTDELVPKDVTYKITASNVNKLNPDTIKFNTYESKEGTAEYYLSDIIMDAGSLSVNERGKLEQDKNYKIKIYPNKNDNFSVTKAVFVPDNGISKNILVSQGDYVVENNILTNKKNRAHVKSVKDAHNVINLVDVNEGGFTLGKESSYGELSINVTDMKNEPFIIKEYCRQTDYTTDTDIVKCKGFELTGLSRLRASGTDSESTITISLSCSSFSFELLAEDDSKRQGAAVVTFEVDGKIDTSISGLWTKARKANVSYGKLHDIKVTIVKAGSYPVSFGNILASRYQIDYSLSKGSVIETGDMKYLPNFTGSNALKISVQSYGTYAPVISYVHVGREITEPYILENVSEGLAGKLNISTNGRIALYETVDGKDSLVETNYTTKSLYTNSTSSSVMVPIDISDISSITSSSRPIKTKTYNGGLVNAIEVEPGESIDTITITGQSLAIKTTQTLRRVLGMDNADQLYCAGDAPGFIVLKENGQQVIRSINHSDFTPDTDIFSFDNIPDDLAPCFVLNESTNSMLKNSKCVGEFFRAYIMAPNTQPYIAYNQATLIQTPKSVKLVNTFSPLLDTSNLMFYQVADAADENNKTIAEVNFIHTENGEEVLRKWSLGLSSNMLQIDYLPGMNNEESCGYEVEVLKQNFVISNTIPLKSEYVINDKVYNLARYILTPPEDMQIDYEKEEVVEGQEEPIYVEDDGFNKLYYSNISKITAITCNGVAVPASDYTLLEEAGIIVWNTKEHIGERLRVAYEYLCPISISYTDSKALYKLAGYSTDAYKLINNEPKILKNMKDGEKRHIDFDGEKAAKIIVRCSNTAFKAFVDDEGNVTVKKDINGDAVAVHTGYYYVDGNEYYLFENVHREKDEQFDGITFDNVKRLASELICSIRSTNHVKDSRMTGKGRNETLCFLDFKKHDFDVEASSRANSLTACETYQMWNSLNMNISIENGFNGKGISFSSTDKTNYALLNITKYIDNNTVLTFKASDTLEVYLLKEKLIHDDHFVKSIYAEKMDKLEPVDENNIRRYVFREIDEDKKYYLMVCGKGIIDDIIIRDYTLGDNFDNYHTKNIDALGYSISEKAVKGTVHELMFDTECNNLDGLEFTEDGTLETGSNVDWGITQLKDFRNEFDSFAVTGGVTIDEESFVCETEGTITSPKIVIPNLKSAMTVYVKINDVPEDKLKNFNIKLMTAANKTNKMKTVTTKKKTNILEVSGKSLESCLQFAVDMEPGKVINSIELYVKYAEVDGEILYAAPQENGTLITKIYDTGSMGNWRPMSLDAEAVKPENIRIQARGCRIGKTGAVWTEWYNLVLNENMEIVKSHTFSDYRFFQFKIFIDNADANIKINSLNLEVV